MSHDTCIQHTKLNDTNTPLTHKHTTHIWLSCSWISHRRRETTATSTSLLFAVRLQPDAHIKCRIEKLKGLHSISMLQPDAHINVG